VELSRYKIFEDLTDEELKFIYKMFGRKILSPGEALFFEGEVGDNFYIIESGTISICIEIKGVGVEEVASLHKGDFFGEMALIEDVPRSASAVGRDKVSLLYLNRADFLKLIEENITVANKILKALVLVFCERLRDSVDRLRSFYLMNRTFGDGNGMEL